MRLSVKEMKNRNRNIEYLFVDGYNIINSWGSLKKLAEESFEDARMELLEILVEHGHLTGIKIIVVFDGHLVKGNIGERGQYKGIEVVFTKEHETADNYIERTLDEIGRIKKVRVATSDWVEQQIVLSRGGTRISAKELEVEIYNEKNNLRRQSKNKNQKNSIQISSLGDDLLDKLKDWKNLED